MGDCRNLKAATVHAVLFPARARDFSGCFNHVGLVSSEGCGRRSCQVVSEDRVCSKRGPGRGEWLLVYFFLGGGRVGGEAVCTRSYFLASVHIHFPLNRS